MNLCRWPVGMGPGGRGLVLGRSTGTGFEHGMVGHYEDLLILPRRDEPMHWIVALEAPPVCRT